MKNKYCYFPIVLFVALLASACSKEQASSDKLKGKWQVTEIRFNDDSVFNDFSKISHEIEFFGGEKAYTTTFLGAYTINYSDENIKDIIDTFRYDIKNDQLAITYVKNSTVSKIIRYRYKIETLKESELYINRTPFDTITAYIKAIK